MDPPRYGYDDFQPNASHSSYGAGLLSAPPSMFNFEDVTSASLNKPYLQQWWLKVQTDVFANVWTGPSANTCPTPLQSPLPLQQTGTTFTPNFVDFLNWYFYTISLVDAQINLVLTTVFPGFNVKNAQGNPSSNTVVIFLSDHGDFGGSHGLHAKTGAVYDEALRVPLYVMLPSQQGAMLRTQMCSMVDIFRLIVELALGTTYNWAGDPSNVYVDQASRQSLFNFIHTPSTTGSPGHPDTLHIDYDR